MGTVSSSLTPPSGEAGTPASAVQAAASPMPSSERVDVAVNIFAKPFQTALALLSLLKQSSAHVGTIWLQYEPVGSRHDSISPYTIARYLLEEVNWPCRISQPEFWLARAPVDRARLGDAAYRMGIRYQYAFERSQSRKLLLMHNDIFVFRDALGDMLAVMGDAFAIGSVGQCWNCPANKAAVMKDVMGSEPCSSERYAEFRPDAATLRRLYAHTRELGIFVRPYDEGFADDFDKQPWPLPECRVNEWFCLLDLERTRPHCVPFGPALPPGAFSACGSCNLDTAVPWFRAMHARGFHARHFNLNQYLQHWVGTGNKTPRRYALAEDKARRLLQTHFPDYMAWLGHVAGAGQP